MTWAPMQAQRHWQRHFASSIHIQIVCRATLLPFSLPLACNVGAGTLKQQVQACNSASFALHTVLPQRPCCLSFHHGSHLFVQLCLEFNKHLIHKCFASCDLFGERFDHLGACCERTPIRSEEFCFHPSTPGTRDVCQPLKRTFVSEPLQR